MKYSSPSQYAWFEAQPPVVTALGWQKLLQITQKARPASPDNISDAITKVFGDQVSLVVDVKES